MGNNRPDRKSARRSLTAADIEALSVDFDAPTADLLPSSSAGVAELVQARLKVSQPGDSLEVEAESTADAFVSATPARTNPRKGLASVNRSADNDGLVGVGLHTTDETGARIGAAKGGGVGLRPDVRARFESFFGTDLGAVRVHDDSRSDTLCRSISAEAFTAGRDVFFTRGGYSPGSAEGDRLLAHELTHVVQQNGSESVARRATPDVMRAGDEAPRLTKKTEREPTQSLTSTASGGVSTAAVLGSNIGGTFGKLDDVDGVMKVKEGVATDSLNLGGIDASAAMQASGSFGLFDAVAQLFDSVTSLFNNWNGHSFDSAMNAGVNAVKSSLSTAQSSIQIAAASGAAIGAAVIPGLGLAIAVIDLVKQVLRAVDLYKAKTNATKKLDELTGKTALSPKGMDITLSPEDEKLKEALTRLRSDANWEMVRTITRIVGDIVIIGGQIGTLAGGAGAIATLVGGAVLGIAAITGKIQGWAEANSVQKSRAAQQADPDNHLLQIERLKVDTYYSACELINYSALAVSGETGEVDNSVVDLVKPFGIDAAWLSRFNEGGRTEAMLDSGAKIVCEKLGKSPNPTTFMQDVMKVVGALKTGLTWVATGVGYVLKFAGRALGFVAGLVLAALGVGVGILVHPLLGMPLIDSIGPVANGIAKGTDTMVDGVGKATDSVGALIDASLGGFKTYFVDEGDIRLRAAQKFAPIIRTYFAEKKDNGTDVKADSLTSKIKDEYTNLASIAKNKSPKDKPGYNNPAGAVGIIDSVIVDIIKASKPERVDLETVRVTKGKVTWKYLGGGLIKTKGMLAGIKNFFGGEKYEKV